MSGRGGAGDEFTAGGRARSPGPWRKLDFVLSVWKPIDGIDGEAGMALCDSCFERVTSHCVEKTE